MVVVLSRKVFANPLLTSAVGSCASRLGSVTRYGARCGQDLFRGKRSDTTAMKASPK